MCMCELTSSTQSTYDSYVNIRITTIHFCSCEKHDLLVILTLDYVYLSC